MAGTDAKYRQVVEWVRDNIENGTLKSGDRLMSEMELSEQFGVSRQTIRHATGELVNEGLLTRVKGSVTYIGGAAEPALPKREKTMTIAVVSTFYESYIFPDTLKGIERVLSQNDYMMQVTFTDNRLYREEAILRSILEKDNIDGLIVEPTKSALPNPNLRYYEEIRSRNIPVIFFNAFYPTVDVPCVRIDDAKIAEDATKVLIDAGHTNIAGIFKADDGQGPLRYKGFLSAMIESGLRARQEKVLWLDTPMTVNLEEVGDYLFKRLEGATGVVCYNDQVAYQLIELALKRGMNIPEDLSVVGIDDSYLADVGKVPFTSFKHPKEFLGRKVAENLLKMIDDPAFDGNYLFDSEPVYRGSVKEM
ncbi:MAG: GntR family transcriptional regulator [Blautia sp.]|nr:GntR family transcriptional regulator [Blautia sp.]